MVVVHKASTANSTWSVSMCVALKFLHISRDNIRKATLKKTLGALETDCDHTVFPLPLKGQIREEVVYQDVFLKPNLHYNKPSKVLMRKQALIQRYDYLSGRYIKWPYI